MPRLRPCHETPREGCVMASHGTTTRYNAGCRCSSCRDAIASYRRSRRRRGQDGGSGSSATTSTTTRERQPGRLTQPGVAVDPAWSASPAWSVDPAWSAGPASSQRVAPMAPAWPAGHAYPTTQAPRPREAPRPRTRPRQQPPSVRAKIEAWAARRGQGQGQGTRATTTSPARAPAPQHGAHRSSLHYVAYQPSTAALDPVPAGRIPTAGEMREKDRRRYPPAPAPETYPGPWR